MKIYASAIIFKSEWQASFQSEECGFCEARPFQDEQRDMIERGTMGAA